MDIRPIAGYVMGEIGRSTTSRGASGGPAAFFSGRDVIALGSRQPTAGLYSPSPFFKMMGAVELMSEEPESPGDFTDASVLI